VQRENFHKMKQQRFVHFCWYVLRGCIRQVVPVVCTGNGSLLCVR
jgi:hypothetical protein